MQVLDKQSDEKYEEQRHRQQREMTSWRQKHERDVFSTVEKTVSIRTLGTRRLHVCGGQLVVQVSHNVTRCR